MDPAFHGGKGFGGLDDWLAWLVTLSPAEIELGLDRVSQVLDRLQPARPGRVIHVAGTNGKGSSVAMLEAILLCAGESVGSYISPHVDRYNERIRIGGQAVSDARIISAFERVEAARRGVPLTYFEFGTLAAVVVFEQGDVDNSILEVGMGGRLDAVNAIEPDGGIITNVSLDHCEWLGGDIESIGREKAGIFRRHKPFVYGASDVPDSVLDAADRHEVDLRLLGRDFGYRMGPGANDRWSWYGRHSELDSLVMPALAGRFQLQNAAGALALVEALQIGDLLDPDLVNTAFGGLELAGRCQSVERERSWLLDVAHNADAARVLSEFLADRPARGRTLAVIGILADKDLAGIVTPLRDPVDSWVAVTPSSPRAVPAGSLAAGIANLCDKPCLVADSLADAMAFAFERTTGDDRILVTGSFYVVGPALNWLETGLSPAAGDAELRRENRIPR